MAKPERVIKPSQGPFICHCALAQMTNNTAAKNNKNFFTLVEAISTNIKFIL